MLEGATHDTLSRWDAVSNGDGPLTVRRLTESGNAFHGWPVELLEALDAQWKVSADRGALIEILQGWRDNVGAHVPDTVAGEDGMVYDGQERRSAFTVAIDLKTLLFLVGCIGPLAAIISLVLQVRQDVRSNTQRIMEVDQREKSHYEEVHAVAEEFKRSKLIFCQSVKRDSSAKTLDADC